MGMNSFVAIDASECKILEEEEGRVGLSPRYYSPQDFIKSVTDIKAQLISPYSASIGRRPMNFMKSIDICFLMTF